jgi:hypothetical protein
MPATPSIAQRPFCSSACTILRGAVGQRGGRGVRRSPGWTCCVLRRARSLAVGRAAQAPRGPNALVLRHPPAQGLGLLAQAQGVEAIVTGEAAGRGSGGGGAGGGVRQECRGSLARRVRTAEPHAPHAPARRAAAVRAAATAPAVEVRRRGVAGEPQRAVGARGGAHHAHRLRQGGRGRGGRGEGPWAVGSASARPLAAAASAPNCSRAGAGGAPRRPRPRATVRREQNAGREPPRAPGARCRQSGAAPRGWGRPDPAIAAALPREAPPARRGPPTDATAPAPWQRGRSGGPKPAARRPGQSACCLLAAWGGWWGDGPVGRAPGDGPCKVGRAAGAGAQEAGGPGRGRGAEPQNLGPPRARREGPGVGQPLR